MPRLIDMIFFFYFFTHIPITILVDLQPIFPAHFYPQQLLDVKAWYCDTFRDPLMANPPPWFTSLVFCELCLQLPFFFFAAYGFLKGAKQNPWLRMPCVVYGTHVATTLMPIMCHVLTYDFSKDKLPGPRNMNERLFLCSIYSPYLIIPIAITLDALFSSAYRQPQTQRQQKKLK